MIRGKAFSIKRDGVEVSVDISLAKRMDDAFRFSADAAVKLARRERGKIYAAARRQWPVKTGRSRDGLTPYELLDMDRGEMRIGIRNPVEYARFVRITARRRRGGRVRTVRGATYALVALLRTPFKRVATRQMKREFEELMGVSLRKALKGGAGG